MSAPQVALTPDYGVRTITSYDLEVTLVKHIKRLFDVARLDNPTLNLAQPDVVPFDYTQRAQTLTLKVPPRVERGRVPRTVTGEISVDKLPDVPAIIVQAVGAKVLLDSSQITKTVTARIFVNAYDENPDSQGYQDCVNMMEALEIYLTSYGFMALDQAYAIELPIEWKVIEADTFPHFIGEMTTMWKLPAGRPMPDLLESIIPGEGVVLGLDPLPLQEVPQSAIP